MASKLTSVSSQTMKLLLDRQSGRRVDDARIDANMRVLADGLAAGKMDAGLKRQYWSMKAMLGNG